MFTPTLGRWLQEDPLNSRVVTRICMATKQMIRQTTSILLDFKGVVVCQCLAQCPSSLLGP